MSRRKTERLLGLVVCLLSSERYLTALQIRAAVPGYPESFEAFKRMFERDKEELRELGIPLETGSNSPLDEEAGYRIPRQAYVLPEIRLEPDEAAVLSLAAGVWRRAELAGAAAGAGGRGRVRAAVAGGAGPAAGRLRLPGGRAQRAAAAAPGAVGRGEPARPLVRGRARPRPGRGPGVPAEPHRGAGRVQRARRVGDRAGRRGRAGNRSGVGHPAAAAAGRGAPGPAGRRARHPPVRHLGAAGRCWLGPGRDAVLRRGLVRRAPRLVRPLGGRGRARRPAGSGYHPAEGSAGMTAPGPAPRTSTARLQRLLALVPYVVSRK